MLTGTNLTDRQLEVLVAYITHGTASAASEHLAIAPRTVKDHLDVIRRKLDCETVHELPLAAIRRGIITLELGRSS